MRKGKIVIEDRQARCFDLAIQGFPAAAIAKIVGTHRETVSLDIAAEGRRRGAERSADRADLIERNVSHYEKLVSDSSLRVAALQTAANAEPDPHVSASLRAIIPREILTQLKAREQAAKTLGLYAPLLIDVSASLEVQILEARLRAAENNIKLRALADQRERYLNGEGDLPEAYVQ